MCIESSYLLRVDLKETCEDQGHIHVSLPCILKSNQLLSNLLQSPFLGVSSVACPCLEMLYCGSEVEGVCCHNVNEFVCRQRDKYYRAHLCVYLMFDVIRYIVSEFVAVRMCYTGF